MAGKKKPNKAREIDSSEDEGGNTDIKTMFSEIMKELKGLNVQFEKLREETKKDISDLRKELKITDKKIEEKYHSIQEQIDNKDKKVQENIKRIEDRINTLEEEEERRQRRERKNNIVIKSKEFKGDNDNETIRKVEDILHKLDFNGEYKRVTQIGKDRFNNCIVKVELKNFQDKISIMKKKIKLKGEECFIDSDLTKKEREIQQAIRQRAREERENGNIVKVGYQKLSINDKWVNWRDMPPRYKT